MTPSQIKANDIAQSDGASIWLSSLPLKRDGFNLTKREFYDAVRLRYGWTPKNIPNECVCGGNFTIDHALSCKLGGFITLRHNELREIMADLLSTVCKDVCKKPILTSKNDEDEQLRADECERVLAKHATSICRHKGFLSFCSELQKPIPSCLI